MIPESIRNADSHLRARRKPGHPGIVYPNHIRKKRQKEDKLYAKTNIESIDRPVPLPGPAARHGACGGRRCAWYTLGGPDTNYSERLLENNY